jgi:hypothetical protein
MTAKGRCCWSAPSRRSDPRLRLWLGVDLSVVSVPRNRHLRQALVHELFAGSLLVDVDQYAVALCPWIQRDS